MSKSQNRARHKSGLSPRLAATALVTIVIDKQASLDDLTDRTRGLSAFLKLDGRDQALARAIALTTLRHGMRIETILNHCWDRKPPKRARFLYFTLMTAAAQILFMDTPESAAVNLATSAIKRERSTNRFAAFANAVLRKLVHDRQALLAASTDVLPFPPFLRKHLGKDFGKANLADMGVVVSRSALLDVNGRPGWIPNPDFMVDLPGTSARLTSEDPVTEIPGYETGEWWVQDIAAAQPARLLADVRGKAVADLCAAPGGKTMQLASLGAEVTAVDVSPARLKRLEENLSRTGLQAKLVTANLLEWEPNQTFDAILLDAPCSATGTLRRHPDILWNRTDQQIEALVTLQKQMLIRAQHWLKSGGVLVYANCSLLKAEGEDLLAGLDLPELVPQPIIAGELPGLENCVNGRGQFRSLPHYLSLSQDGKASDAPGRKLSGMDGFFAARFRKR